MSDDVSVNNVRWKIGWSPWRVIIGVTIAVTLVGAAVERPGIFFVLGVLAGIVTWYWGVREINANYNAFLQKFIGESERNAKRGIDLDEANLYNLTYYSGNSPVFVEASDRYTNTTIVVSDTSINLNKGAEYDMRSRSGNGGGTNEELYYDQVTGVQSHQDGAFTELEIKTSGGNSTRVSSSATDTVDQVVSEVRQRVREIKNPQRGQNRSSSRGQGSPSTEGTPSSADDSPASNATASDSNSARRAGPSEAPEPATHPVTAVSDRMASRTRPSDPLAAELCRTLSAGSPDEERVEDILADVIDRLESAGTVADAVADLDGSPDQRQLESARRSVASDGGTLAIGVESALDRALELERELDEARSSADTDAGRSDSQPTQAQKHREQLDELEAEIDRHKQRYDRIETAAGSVCQEAARTDAVSFRTTDADDRLVELADALDAGDVVFDTPGGSLAPIIEDVEHAARPQTAQSRELLTALGSSDWAGDDVSAVLTSTVESLDEHADLRAAVAEIEARDVRRRLDSLDAELEQEEGPVYRHLADRVRELEAMVDGGVDGVQLFAIYQECTFYDRTLVPRLSRSDSSSDSVDVDRRARDIEARIASINDEYVSVRADHNHTIPNHFLELADALCERARRAGDAQPRQAAGQLAAAGDLLDHVEELYERNEYSVMLRRLRG
jgi:tetrahydromethanopterin S-methyltransferase subunit G